MAWTGDHMSLPPEPLPLAAAVGSSEDADWLLQSSYRGHQRAASSSASAPSLQPTNGAHHHHQPLAPNTLSPRAGGGGAAAAAAAVTLSASTPAMIPAHLRLPGDGYSGSGVTLPEGVSLATTLFFADHPQLDEKVIMLGEGEVGKTSLWNCLREGGKPMELGKHVTTIGADYWHVNTVLAHIPPVSLKMMFWDTAGQERFNSLVGAYVKQSSVVLLVFDLTARHTFQLLEKHWLPLVKEKAPRAHRIYVGNKSDMSEKRFGTRNEILQELASINDSIADDNYIETSCLAGTNVARLFIRARSLFIENDETARGVLSGDTLIIDRLQKRTQLQAAVVRLDDIAPRRTSSSGRRGGSSSSSRVTPAWPPNNNNNNTKNAQNAPCNC